MKKIKLLIAISIGLLTIWPKIYSTNNEFRLLRFPDVYENKIVFSYAGDLYIVDINGGVARKITNHIGYEMFAKFSPDGKNIAFTAQYDGNTEVYIMPSDGGTPKRLTYTATLNRDEISDRMGPNNIVMTWTPDGSKIIYRSRKQSFNDFKGQLFAVSVNGGISEELPLSDGGFCSFSPDGNQLAFNRVFREFRTWKYYRGGMADDIRILDINKKTVIKITDNPAQDIFPMWIENEIYFISDRDRIMNLFVYNLNTKETKKITDFKEFDIKFPSFDKNHIVFENGGYIYKYNIKSKELSKVEIVINDDFIYSRPAMVDASKHIFSEDISPDGKRIVLSGRGDIFTVPSKEGITRNLTRTPGVHERDVTWSPDGKYIAFLSDKSGEFEIYIQNQDGSEPPVQITKNADTYYYKLKWSPNSKKILWSDRKLRLRYVDINSKEITKVAYCQYGEITNYNWSPDSKWITFDMPGSNEYKKVYIYNLSDKKYYPVTDEWYNSDNPSFSSDGKYLLFSSDRDFNPIYSEIEWNYAYKNMAKIYMILLAKSTPSPFAYENDEVEVTLTEDPVKKDTGKKNEKDSSDKKSKDIVIDVDGINERIIAIPVNPANYYNIYCINDKIYYIQMLDGGQNAKLYDLKAKKETDLGIASFKISANNKKMLAKSAGKYAVVDLPVSKVDMHKTIDLSGLKMMTDYKEEWKQIFNESWRQMRDFFYVENMHGLDWPAIRQKYAPLVEFVNHRDDLTYIIGEMIGELNVGHAYVQSGEKPRPEKIKMGLLGAKISKHNSGYFKIDKILKGAPWSNELRSPLSEPGINVSEGEYIIAIDGIQSNQYNDIYSALVNKADKLVELTINSKPQNEGSRKILVKPISDESELYYYEWVQKNIEKVNKETNGEVGYLHIPDMVTSGLNEFAKYFYPQLDKKALIIDGRGNGGGNVSPMIVERLMRQVTRANMARNFEVPYHTPNQMMLGPKILIIDKYSASDGDLFPYAFKKHKIGTVIGERSWGGVVGIRGSLPFIDGGDLRKPEFASYSSEKSEWIIEGFGVEPDIYVENDPVKEYYGEDAQLDKAIEIIKEQLKEYKGIPPIPAAPDKSK